MGLLPKDYDVEKLTSNKTNLIVNLQDLPVGNHKFRILGLRYYFQTWTPENRPIRSRIKQKRLPFCGRLTNNYGDEKWTHIWAMLVWDYQENDLKILSVKQGTVQKQLTAFDQDPDLGALNEYDIKIKKEGTGKETEYTVNRLDKSKIAKHIQESLDNAPINLDALIYNGYPDDEQWQDKALDRLIKNLDLACQEAVKRGIELEIPATTDLSELQSVWEKALDLMPLQKKELPKVAAEDSIDPETNGHSAELEGIPF